MFTVSFICTYNVITIFCDRSPSLCINSIFLIFGVPHHISFWITHACIVYKSIELEIRMSQNDISYFMYINERLCDRNDRMCTLKRDKILICFRLYVQIKFIICAPIVVSFLLHAQNKQRTPVSQFRKICIDCIHPHRMQV